MRLKSCQDILGGMYVCMYVSVLIQLPTYFNMHVCMYERRFFFVQCLKFMYVCMYVCMYVYRLTAGLRPTARYQEIHRRKRQV